MLDRPQYSLLSYITSFIIKGYQGSIEDSGDSKLK